MSWGDVLAAVSGAGEGELQREREEAQRKQQLDLANSKGAVAQVIQELKNQGLITVTGMKEEGATGRTTQTNQTRRDINDQNIALGNDKLGALANHWKQISDDTRRNQDLQEGRFWGGTMPFDYYRTDTQAATSRANAGTAATASNYRADTAADASRYAVDARGDTSDQARRDRLRVNAARLALQRTKPKPGVSSLLTGGASSPEAEATKYDDEYNRLLKELDDPDAMAALMSSAQSEPSGPPAVTPSNLFGALGLSPRRTGAPPAGAPATPPAPSAPLKAPGGLVVGATATLKNGKKVIVTKVNPDGTFEYK